MSTATHTAKAQEQIKVALLETLERQHPAKFSAVELGVAVEQMGHRLTVDEIEAYLGSLIRAEMVTVEAHKLSRGLKLYGITSAGIDALL